MQRVGVFSTAFLLSLLLGAPALGYAQHEQQGDKQGKAEKQATPERQKGHQQPRDPGNQQQHAQRQQQDRGNQQQHVQRQQQDPGNQQQHAQRQQQDRGNQQQHAQRPQHDQNNPRQQHVQQRRSEGQRRAQQGEQRSAWHEHRARSWESEHRSWQQRGGYNGYRIPDDHFRRYYGRSHFFRVYSLPFMVEGGYPRFQYGGYWFSCVDPYPEYWGDNWYEHDDVYVDYTDGGYYLYNRRFPRRPGLAISISF